LLKGQPGVGDIGSVRSRKMPYWLAPDQRRVVRWLRARGAGPTWFCDANDAARGLLTRAGIAEEFIVDVKDHPLLPGEHVTEQWRRIAQIMPPSIGLGRGIAGISALDGLAEGCCRQVNERQNADLDAWMRARGLELPLIVIQAGNKRTMRRGPRRLAVNSKYWPPERWAAVLQYLRARCPKHRIVLLGTGPEYRLNQELAARAGVEALYNAADDLPVPRLVALLNRAAGLITVDSGPAHAAAAVGCPQVVLFGKALPSLYRPWGTAGADVKVLCGRIDGEPDMLGIATGDVQRAWAELNMRAVDARG